MCQVHEMDPGTCAYCDKPSPAANFEARMGRTWALALATDPLADVPQVTATIVPVPSTSRLELVPRTKFGGHGGSLPRNEFPGQHVIVERPDDTERLFARLAAARSDWVQY